MTCASSFSQAENIILDRILESRRSIRTFTAEVPPKDEIRKIIRAGLLAPYPGLYSSEEVYFRRFVVLRKDSQQMTKVTEIAKRQMTSWIEQVTKELQANASLKNRWQDIIRRLEGLARNGVPGIGTVPYYIVVVERKGVSCVDQQSLAHCLQNMWLKATALGLGFQLVSATAQMAQDREFCSLLGVPYGEVGLNGCAIGYPMGAHASILRPNVDEVTTWIE